MGGNVNRHVTTLLLASAVLVCGLPGVAFGQGVDIEVPVLVYEETPTGPADDSALDLANIVQSAAKGVTTVQEAPAIVTVLTAEDFEDRGWTTLAQAYDTVPGYLHVDAIHGQFPFPTTRGIVQAIMYNINGVSMFDPQANVPSVWRVQPVETIKRVELITGPGGVLWGANSYLGIVNVITKDATDVDGVEADVGLGHGNGDREYLRGYVMAGVPELFSDNSSLFIHTSFESYIGAGMEMPRHLFSSPLPNPNSQLLYGPLVKANPERSFLFNLDGKLSLGALNVYFSVPFVERHTPLGFPGFVTEKDLAEDSLRNDDGSLACDPNNPPDPLFDPTDRCLDVDRRARDNQLNWFDRYVIGEYRTRFADGKAGITLKGYGIQFVREFPQLGILAPVASLLEGGIAFKFDFSTYRTGALLDGDVELPADARLLYGIEASREWLPDRTELSRQGPGSEARFIGPYQLERLPFVCPRQRELDENGNPTGGVEIVPECPLTMAFQTSRATLGAYVNPQWKLTDNLILDAGARVNVAPTSLGEVGYDPEPLFSGALVYGFLDNWHLKVNYAEGFRSPVFNNLVSNGEGVQIDGSPDIENERSQAGQVEVNARLFKGQRRIRELNFRADYSYTKLENLIQIQQGRYANTADRGIHSAELLAKLYVQGGHQLNLAYTWLQMNTADKGKFKSMPEHWFHLSGVFALSDSLTATTSLRVLGALEDPNKIVEYRIRAEDEEGQTINTMTGMRENLQVMQHEMVMDRLPPSSDLTLGLQYTGIDRLRLAAFAYNAFNNRYFQPDVFFDYEPRLEYLPNPARDFRFQVHATYSY
jgi:outer membrane receptor protein involved in Fe transport